MKIVKLFFLTCLLFGCNQETNEDEKASNIFPSTLEFQKCAFYGHPDELIYFKYMITFDVSGYKNSYLAIYDDNSCETFSHDSSLGDSRYPYELGKQVTNTTGTLANELYFPAPENAGVYGTVFQIEENILCFADGTFTLENSVQQPSGHINFNSSFAPISIDGDFSNFTIDKDNCFNIISIR